MKDLVTFLVKNIIGSDDFSVEESDADGIKTLVIQAKPEFMGLIIGKGGKTIKTIRNLLKVRATLEKSSVNLTVEEAV